jgi:hypothetical protein
VHAGQTEACKVDWTSRLSDPNNRSINLSPRVINNNNLHIYIYIYIYIYAVVVQSSRYSTFTIP